MCTIRLSKIFILLISFFVLALSSCRKKREGMPKILVFSKTMGYNHSSIPSGIAAIQALGTENNFQVDTTKSSTMFREEILKDYAAVVFLNTTGNVLNHEQEAAFERYIQSGGGFVGIHAATDTEYDWNWYGRLVGAYFESHPPGVAEADFHIRDHDFIATSNFDDDLWVHTDELYNFRKIYEPVNVLIEVDENTYEGGTNGAFHPMAWYHEYDGGRSFYTALGHTDESFSEQKFLKHILGGIQYAIGENYELEYKKAIIQIPPEQDRFSKHSLTIGQFYEPTEMTILPNNDVLISQRRGEVMHFDSESGTLKELVKLDVYHTALNAPDVNVENGLMGLQKDPDFEDNQWIYLYFSPTGDKYVNRLSRFKYIDGEFDLSSEQIILEVPTDREICCHTGGSIAFGPDKLLYLSTGDNSTPFDEPDADFVNQGYAPLNDLPGKSQYDARRSSGNTNDLRGKVLRIKVESDGSYSIPEGNLFPEGKAKTRPEIYTMGHRNPYRISIDQKNSNLYWGDVGPDAQEDSLQMRGPRGYDELNQATKAGNFGWPLFIGNNGAYVAYNYKNGKSGVAYDPLRPVNDSRNNTGISELPEAIPAMVYYPYAASPDFPQVGTGGRNAMAGPVYYSDLYEGGEKLPSYFDGKLFFYDWMRGWIKAISFFEDGTFNKMEPFASEIELNNLIDMELGPDGRLYLLEYGSGWYTQNPDSGLSYVEYNGGNRPPIIDDFVVDVDSGPLPLEVVLKVRARDLEKDSLSYIWDLGDGNTMETVTPELSYSYGEVGEYEVSVRAKDPSEASVKSELINIVAGNSRPQVTIELKSANQSFYLPGLPIVYEVSVVDTESEEPVDLDQVYVAVDYITGMDESQLSAGHKAFSAVENGKALSLSLDCKACHKEKDVSIGPSYFEVSNKYKNDPQAGSYLQQKMITGGAGVWGEVAMPAHPDLSEAESGMLVKYILSLANKDDLKKNSLPAKGVVVAESGSPNTIFQLSASYTDQGYGGVKALTGYAAVRLKSNTFLFSDQIPHEGLIPFNFNNTDLFLLPAEDSWFALNNLDLRGIGSAVMMVGWQQAPLSGLNFELRLDAPNGPKIGSGSLPKPSPNQEGGIVRFRLDKGSDLKNQNVYFVYRHDSGKARGESPIALLNISFQAK